MKGYSNFCIGFLLTEGNIAVFYILIHYLDNALGERVEKKDIETFIREGHFALENDERVAAKGETKTYKYQLPESIRQNADLIDQQLSSIRICDPAIGSGAFPVGLLHELVNAMLVLKPHLSYDYLTDKLKGFGFEHRESVNDSRYIYRLKRHIIQESIYGVDIDASAIDIARLRLWLSLVVDEDDLDPIETLPNLDYKIVCGNSLIGLPDSAMKDLTLEAELEKLKEKFYNVTDDAQKKALRKQINTKIRELLDSAEQFAGYKIDFDFKLFFSEVWREKGGFDVVIGNPPYVNIVNINELFRNQLKAIYSITKNKVDLYAYFIQKGSNLLKANASLIYIVPHTWKATDSFFMLREYIINNFKIEQIVNLDMGVFAAVVTPMIVHISNKKSNSYKITVKDKDFDFYSTIDIQNVLVDELKAIDTESPQAFLNIYKKIETDNERLESVLKFTRGIKTSDDKRFISESKIDEHSYKVYRGKNIRRYKAHWGKEYIWYKPEKMKEKVGCLPHTQELFKVPEKLITQRVNSSYKLIVAYDDKQNFFLDTTNVSKYESVNRSYKFKYLLCVLNSSPVNFWYCFKFRMPTIGLYELHSIPIVYASSDIQDIIIVFADYLLFLDEEKKTILYAFYYSLIDSIAFELYFPKEIKSAGKEILKHLGALKPITDEMSEEEKLAIIQSEFERLYDPNHPVRFAIETLDSVEEVRIIKEALK